MSARKWRVILLTEIMSPYRTPVFNEIAKDDRIRFEVIYLSEMSGTRKWRVDKENMRYRYRHVPGFGLPLPDRFPIFFNPGVLNVLLTGNPDIIICGGLHHFSFLLALAYAKMFRRKFFLWSETHEKSIRIQHPLAHAYRRWMIRQACRYIVPGKQSVTYLTSCGVNPESVYVAPNSVDNDFFCQKAQFYRAQKDRIKSERRYPKFLILCVTRIIHWKGVPVLLEAYSRLPNQDQIGLVIVGDGPEEETCRQYVRKNHLTNVFFEGFKQQEELPYYYGIADLFVMPSFKDEWGLVLNEAMASGLPVIASDEVGAAADLIVDNWNGYRFPKGDSVRLAAYIQKVFTDQDLRCNMTHNSLTLIKNFSPVRCAEGFIRAILEVALGPDEACVTNSITRS